MRNRSLCSSGISASVSSSSAGPPPGMPWLRLTAPGSARWDGWYSPEWFLRHASAYHFGAYLNCTQTRASAVSFGALVWYSLQSNCVLAQLGREVVIEYQLAGYQDGGQWALTISTEPAGPAAATASGWKEPFCFLDQVLCGCSLGGSLCERGRTHVPPLYGVKSESM